MNDKSDNIWYLNKKKIIHSRILDLMEIANAEKAEQINNVNRPPTKFLKTSEKKIDIERFGGAFLHLTENS